MCIKFWWTYVTAKSLGRFLLQAWQSPGSHNVRNQCLSLSLAVSLLCFALTSISGKTLPCWGSHGTCFQACSVPGLATLAEYFFPRGSSRCPKAVSGGSDLGPQLIIEPATVMLIVHSFLIFLPLEMKSRVCSRPELQGWSQGWLFSQRTIRVLLLEGGKINSRQTQKLISTLPSVILWFARNIGGLWNLSREESNRGILGPVYVVTFGASSGWGLAASRTNFVIRGLELAVPPSLLGRGKGVLQIESITSGQ